ncbi:hypothetical protein GALL_184600 [mine drainage metagenome]|uniref:Uncharacterized protein n=1 Tax=mine drainage metagenome TaxID=410659 RepID=A0A1J5SCT0_9ZZZZ
MLFSEEFLASLKDDPIVGTSELIKKAQGELIEDQNAWHDSDYNVLIETYALLFELIESNLLEIEPPDFELTGNQSTDCSQINQWLNFVDSLIASKASKLKLESLKSHFKTSLGTTFCYEFSQGDLERIQTLINQLRDMVSQSNHFEKDHQRRLLKRLESLQAEMHKRVSDLDRFWGLIGDAGVVLGKFGKDAKPFVDRIRDIADIVWRTQSRAEELPSGTSSPLLENKDDIQA